MVGVGVEDAVAADADQDLRRGVGQCGADRDRVVAGVEHEHRHLAVVGQALYEAGGLLDGERCGIAGGRDPGGVHRRGPGVEGPVELGDPLVGPAGDDGLAGRVFGRRVVEAPLGAGLPVAARPGGGVDGEHGRPGGWAVHYQQVAHPLMVDSSQGQRFVQAAMAATERRFQAQRRYRAGRCRRTQGCVAQLEGRVGPAGQATEETGTEVDQCRHRGARLRVSGVLCAHQPSSHTVFILSGRSAGRIVSTRRKDLTLARSNAQRLATYQSRYRELVAQLGDVGYIAAGSITCRHTRCGTPSCRCHGDPPQLHGPYWQWTAKVDGKTVTRRLSQSEAELYQEWIANDRQLRAIITQMRQVAAKATELTMKEVKNKSAKV